MEEKNWAWEGCFFESLSRQRRGERKTKKTEGWGWKKQEEEARKVLLRLRAVE